MLNEASSSRAVCADSQYRRNCVRGSSDGSAASKRAVKRSAGMIRG
jgi:hypothetical protein